MEHLIPIFGIVFVIGPVASLFFSWTPLGNAVIERLRGRPASNEEDLLLMQDEIERLHTQIADQD